MVASPYLTDTYQSVKHKTPVLISSKPSVLGAAQFGVALRLVSLTQPHHHEHGANLLDSAVQAATGKYQYEHEVHLIL